MVILIIAIIILGALFNALLKANIIEFSGNQLHEKDRLAGVKKDLEKIKVDGDKQRYSKKELIEALEKVGFRTSSDGDLTSAISPEGKGDLSVNITGGDEIDSLRVQARIKESKKDHEAINELYFKKIYRLTGLSQDWLDSSMKNLNKVGRSESFSLDETVDGNIVSLGYNRGIDSFVFNVDFTN